MKSGKIWGNTEALFAQNNVELHRIEIDEGGYCSKHKHEHKWNAFYVETGKLKVEVYKGGFIDITELAAGDMMAVAPGEYHRFEALSDVTAFEIYWVQLGIEDIVREDVGGKRDEAADPGLRPYQTENAHNDC